MVDPQLHLLADAVGMHLQSPRQSCGGRLNRVRVGEDAPPAERVYDQRRAEIAAVCVHRLAVTPGDRRRLSLELRARRLAPQQRTQLAVVERRERPRQRPARGAIRGVDDHLVEALKPRVHQSERLHPHGRHRARGGLALAELVAVDHQHPRARASQLSCDRQPGEAGPADEHVAVALQAGTLRPPLRRSNRHMPSNDTAALRFGRCIQ